jgi:hypothetical protein
MVRKSLIVATLLIIASPLTAQEEYVWMSKRPDSHAPSGMRGASLLDAGAIEVGYRFIQLNSKGVWIGNDSIPLATTLEFYEVAPLSLTNQTHNLAVAYGVTNELTILADMNYSVRQRRQLTDGGVFYVTETNNLGDLSISALYNFVDQGAYKAHIQLGSLIPTGADYAFSETPFSTPGSEALPYDVRPGGGTFALLPGMTAQTQNEVASVGTQITGKIPVGTNGRGYALGNSFDASGWIAYMLSDYFSVSARVHWQNWGGIQGADPSLDTARDPGNAAFFLEGERVDMPIGINFYLPEGARFGGQRLSLEAVFPLSHEYEGPQLGVDWGLVIGWHMAF